MKAKDRCMALKALSARKTRINSKNATLHHSNISDNGGQSVKSPTLSTKFDTVQENGNPSPTGVQSINTRESFNATATNNDNRPISADSIAVSPIKPSHSSRNQAADEELDSWSDSKKSIVLPNGSTLRDVYEHKRADIWGKIARSQGNDAKRLQEEKAKKKVDSERDYLTKLQTHIEIHQSTLGKEREEDEKASIMGLEWATKWENRQKGMTKRREELALEFRNKAADDIQLRSDILSNDRDRRLRMERAYAHNATSEMMKEQKERFDSKERQKNLMEELKKENDENVQKRYDDRQRRIAEEKQGEKIMLQPQDPRERRLNILTKSLELAKENFDLAQAEKKRLEDVEEAEEKIRIKYDAQRWDVIEKREHDKIERRRVDSIKQVAVLNQQLKLKDDRLTQIREYDLKFGKIMKEVRSIVHLNDKYKADGRHFEVESKKQRDKSLVRDKYINDIGIQVEEARHRKFLELVGDMSPREIAWQKSVLERAEQANHG